MRWNEPCPFCGVTVYRVVVNQSGALALYDNDLSGPHMPHCTGAVADPLTKRYRRRIEVAA